MKIEKRNLKEYIKEVRYDPLRSMRLISALFKEAYADYDFSQLFNKHKVGPGKQITNKNKIPLA